MAKLEKMASVLIRNGLNDKTIFDDDVSYAARCTSAGLGEDQVQKINEQRKCFAVVFEKNNHLRLPKGTLLA